MGDLVGAHADAIDNAYDALGRWKREHVRAREGHEHLARALARAVELFNAIGEVDTAFNLAVARDQIPYDARIERRIGNLYWEWRAIGEFLEEELADYIATGHTFEGVDTFRECLAEVRGICTPDHLFFGGPALDELSDRAAAEYREGRTVELLDGLLD